MTAPLLARVHEGGACWFGAFEIVCALLATREALNQEVGRSRPTGLTC
jgi:hypothetical protein